MSISKTESAIFTTVNTQFAIYEEENSFYNKTNKKTVREKNE